MMALGWTASRLAARLYLRAYRGRYRIAVLEPRHAEAAARLLAEEFCRREPLCRHLNLHPEELLPFFRLQVDHVAHHGLSCVALGNGGEVVGAITVEDESAPFIPAPECVTPALAAVDEVLQSLALPVALAAKAKGEVFYCGLAAVTSQHRHSPVLPLMMSGVYLHLFRLGYQRGYAKVTNPAITGRMRRFNRLSRFRAFTVVEEKSDQDLPGLAKGPLKRFRVALLAFPVVGGTGHGGVRDRS